MAFIKTGLGLENPLAKREQKPRVQPLPNLETARLFFAPQAKSTAAMQLVEKPVASKTRGGFGHLIVIPTQNRPALLKKCVGSIVENMRRFGYSKKLRVAVIDDSTTSAFEAQNSRNLRELAAKYSYLIEVIHYDKARQKRFVDEIERKTKTSATPFIFSGKNGKHGYSGVRNFSLLVAMRHAESTDLVTFFDDDITLENMDLRKQGSDVAPARGHLFNFFGKLDSAFTDPDMKIASGRVTKDLLEPQDLIPRFLAKTAIFARNAAANRAGDSLGKVAHRVTNTPELAKGVSYRRGLRLLAAFSHDFLRRGAFSAAIRYYDQNEPMATPIDQEGTLGGANVTVRASVLHKCLPYPSVDIRGEDTTWSMLMYRRLGGGVYRLNLPVLHHKGSSSGLFKEYGNSVSFWPVYEVLKKIPIAGSHTAISRHIRTNATPETIAKGHRMITDHLQHQFPRWDGYAKSINEVFASPTGWWHRDSKSSTAVKRLKRAVGVFSSDKRKEIYQHVLPREKISSGLQKYAGLIEQWPTVLNAARKS